MATMARTWKDALHDILLKKFGDKKGNDLSKKYLTAFPTSYQEDRSPDSAVSDILQMEKISSDNPLVADLYLWQPIEHPLHLKVFQYETPIPLSDILPVLDHMDLRTYNERPYKIIAGKHTIWISDFGVSLAKDIPFDMEKTKPLFEDALKNILLGVCENDGFNRLVLDAGLSWQEIIIIRAYAKYVHQTGFRFSQYYIEKTLAAHPAIVRDLVELFKWRFDPAQQSKAQNQIDTLEEKIRKSLDAVTSLDDDRILRRLWDLIRATLRTNYFQMNADGSMKEYLTFKFHSEKIPELPLPHPLYEIFVYSPRFEGIHLRSAKVARGGIRWSDRREDFRTEILGLMKAQKVKNAVIVPSGAKGGFVLKKLPHQASRDMIQAEVITCYKSFISGLLELTDNLKDKKVIRPHDVVCYDDEDTYLVVAADKGTASFSDIANSISKEHHFWLGDAFASGGSAGYDHKKMGITARGAWESIKRHFLELGINTAKTPFTVIGIGDMSGDVFGNGMLYTRNIHLVAAFDHRNIFIDPDPDFVKSYDERKRLFNLPGSSWEDYDTKLISKGGGIFKRSSKSIPLTPEIQKCLDIKDSSLTPNDLIRAILKAPVDLFYNGGIGTYVKASTESQADVGDRTNDFIRVNGDELRCRIVGEGGNLGFTQLGRVEYALKGGLINTDFIDNSAGVDCSDHEVNVKILLNKEVKKGSLTEVKRNQLLTKMTDEVAQLVLRDNYNQALALSNAAVHSANYLPLYHTYLKELETLGIIDRAVEFLPDEKKFLERRAAGQGLTRPELAVLLSYAKIHIKNEIMQSDVPEDPHFLHFTRSAFPQMLCEAYPKALHDHPLRREIIATQISNLIVNTMGITFVYRMQAETGASICDIIRAYTITVHIYNTDRFQKLIEELDFRIPVKTQYQLLSHIRRLQNLATRWFLRGNRMTGDLDKIIAHYAKPISQLEYIVPQLMVGATKTYMDDLVNQFIQDGLRKDIAEHIGLSRAMYTALNVIEVSTNHHFELIKTAKVYFQVGQLFNLVWFRDQITADTREGHWNTLARLTLRDELDILQKQLTVTLIESNKKETDVVVLFDEWTAKHERIMGRWNKILEMLHATAVTDYVMFFIALRELSELLMGA